MNCHSNCGQITLLIFKNQLQNEEKFGMQVACFENWKKNCYI